MESGSVAGNCTAGNGTRDSTLKVSLAPLLGRSSKQTVCQHLLSAKSMAWRDPRVSKARRTAARTSGIFDRVRASSCGRLRTECF